MESYSKKNAAKLGARIAFVFLIAVCVLAFTAYVILSNNFQNLFMDYTIQLVQSMAKQGVAAVETELNSSLEETKELSSSFIVSDDKNQMDFPIGISHSDILRMVYVSETGSVSSDGRQRDIRGRQDITEALSGKTSIYGPYFNEENEYVICYSSPIFQDDKVIGAFSVEKDGYLFCELIKNIRFVDTGESYIINEEGTDIAVSDPEHISWVNDGYNAQQLLLEKEDPSVRSVMELEQKGLNGESGVGTYYWEGGLCYVVYIPIPSVHWVLLAGLREEELAAMLKSTLLSSIVKGPTLSISVAVFLVLSMLILFWIISSTKKSAEINQKLNFIANYDSLTNCNNRNCYLSVLNSFSNNDYDSLACIYIDANGLHEINNLLGHQAGDAMLKAVADELFHVFPQNEVYRIGGDEFVVFCMDQNKQEIFNKMKIVKKNLKDQGYEISVGIEWQDEGIDIKTIVGTAEKNMQSEKQRYYKENGKERQMRTLNQEVEQMVLEKQDADTFLSVLAPDFKGVYFVNLDNDTIRHLFIPSYFEEMLKETNDQFSKALFLYANRIVMPEYRNQFINFCRYENLKIQLNRNTTPEFIYQKIDGTYITLRILKFKTYTEQNRETLWIFGVNDNL